MIHQRSLKSAPPWVFHIHEHEHYIFFLIHFEKCFYHLQPEKVMTNTISCNPRGPPCAFCLENNCFRDMERHIMRVKTHSGWNVILKPIHHAAQGLLILVLEN